MLTLTTLMHSLLCGCLVLSPTGGDLRHVAPLCFLFCEQRFGTNEVWSLPLLLLPPRSEM